MLIQAWGKHLLTDNGLIATNPIARQVLLDQFVTLKVWALLKISWS